MTADKPTHASGKEGTELQDTAVARAFQQGSVFIIGAGETVDEIQCTGWIAMHEQSTVEVRQ